MANTNRDNVQGSAYIGDEGGLQTRYAHFEGLAVLPMANGTGGNCGPVEVVRLHTAVRIREVKFDFTKAGTPPLVPKPVSDSTEYILNSDMYLPFPSVAPDSSTFIWNAYGTNTFIENSQWTVASGFRIGDAPVQTPAGQLYGYPSSPSPVQGGQNTAQFAEEMGNQATFVGNPYSQQFQFVTKGDAAAAMQNPLSQNSVGDTQDYTTYQYNFPWHYPSAFLSDDMAVGV